jgi:hypothetical protein
MLVVFEASKLALLSTSKTTTSRSLFRTSARRPANLVPLVDASNSTVADAPTAEHLFRRARRARLWFHHSDSGGVPALARRAWMEAVSSPAAVTIYPDTQMALARTSSRRAGVLCVRARGRHRVVSPPVGEGAAVGWAGWGAGEISGGHLLLIMCWPLPPPPCEGVVERAGWRQWGARAGGRRWARAGGKRERREREERG